ncbi:SDR family oxidoreductase [Stella sp.]|uniref:SDR family oxidoreductase n=1 Tax=Stella sp. TaxID=2912054 RepID=UPI0035B1C24C
MSLSPALPRVALVTGGGRRIGRALSLDLAAQGFAVAVHHHRSGAEAEAVASAIRDGGGRAVAVGADLSREAEVEGLVERVAAALGPVGCLVNNASVFDRDEAATATRASWDAHMETNLRAPFLLTQRLAAGLPAGAEAVVVNLLDQRVWSLTPHFVSYTVSKSALWTLTRTLALALAPRIRVNGIGPGPTLPSPRQTDEQFRRQCRSVPLGRGTTPEEICAAARFILSAPSMTGQMIALDGGQHLQWSPAGRVEIEE